MNRTQRKVSSGGVNVGSASLVTIFVVLCLTVFAVLSFLTARSEKQLAQKNAEAVSVYYIADSEAAKIYNAVAADWTDGKLDLLHDGVTVSGGTAEYYVAMSLTQRLHVTLELGDTLQVTCWQVEQIPQAITIDDTLPVWDGE